MLWEKLAYTTAVDCLNEDCTINQGKVMAIIEGWKGINVEEIGEKDLALARLPGVRLVRNQILAVLHALTIVGEDSLQAVLLKTPMELPMPNYGGEVLSFMAKDSGKALKPRVAILASLLTPHRQMSLPTCSINALINAETFNHPERLATVYSKLLQGGSSPISIEFGCADPTSVLISRSLEKGESDRPFIKVPYVKEDMEEKAWSDEGIAYRPDDKGSYLELPVRNLTDLFFANFMADIYSKTEQNQVFIKVKEMYFGIPGDMLNPEACIQASGTLDGSSDLVVFTEADLERLTTELGKLRKVEPHRRLETIFVQPAPVEGDKSDTKAILNPSEGHLENINIDEFLKIDLRSMNVGDSRIIGDINWVDNENCDICYFTLEKISEDKYIFSNIFGPEKDDIQTIGWLGCSDEFFSA